MKYYSTKDKACARAFSLREAVQAGLAPDGGLFVPERIPQADMAVAERLAGESYAALAGYLAELFFGDDIDPGLLRREMERIYDFPLPLRRVGSRYTLELFHGPTFAFKDYGAGFMGRMIGLMGGAGEKLVILTATSGDTGSAVAHGFYGVPGVEVVLLYPEGKISRLQECQMTTLGGNIHPLRVAGTFDDCQRLVKGLFADAKFRAGHRVSSANSINLLPGYRRHSIISTAIACGGSRRAADGLWSWCRAVTTETSRPGCSPAAWGSPSADSSRLRTGTTWCPSSCAAASTVRGRRCGRRPMRWTSERRAISNVCCGSAAVSRMPCVMNWRDSAATMP